MELQESTFSEDGNVFIPECEIKEVKILTSFLVHSYINDSFYLILEERDEEPFKNKYELPRYEVKNLSIENCVKTFSDEFGIDEKDLHQSQTFEYINNELKIRNIFIIFTGKMKDHTKVKMKTKKKIKFYNISNLPDMAFDHEEIVNYYLKEDT